MTEPTKKVENVLGKSKKNRSASYPSIPLKDAIEYIEKIQSSYGNSSFDRDNGVKAMGFNKVTGDSGMKISALVQYQLLSRNGNTYKLSELADRILHHTSEADRASAIATAATSPKLFGKLVNTFSQQAIPALLNNILVREHKINRNVSDRLAKTFKESLEFAELYSNGVVTAEATDDQDPEQSKTPHEPSVAQRAAPARNSGQPVPPTISSGLFSIPLAGGVVLSYPQNLSFQFGIGKFGSHIQALKAAIEATLDKTNENDAPPVTE